MVYVSSKVSTSKSDGMQLLLGRVRERLRGAARRGSERARTQSKGGKNTAQTQNETQALAVAIENMHRKRKAHAAG